MVEEKQHRSKQTRFNAETVQKLVGFDEARRAEGINTYYACMNLEALAEQWQIPFTPEELEQIRGWRSDKTKKSIQCSFATIVRNGLVRFYQQTYDDVCRRATESIRTFLKAHDLTSDVLAYINSMRMLFNRAPAHSIPEAVESAWRAEKKAGGQEKSFEWLARQTRATLLLSGRDGLADKLEALPALRGAMSPRLWHEKHWRGASLCGQSKK